jgi:hypothetical protein
MALQQLPRQRQRVVAPAQSGPHAKTCLGRESFHKVFDVVSTSSFQLTSGDQVAGASSDLCLPRPHPPLAHLAWGDPSFVSISSAAPEQETPL